MHSERAGSLTWCFHQNLMYSFIVTGKLCLFADNRDVYQKPGWTGKQAGTCRSVSYRTSAGLAPAGRVTPARSPVEHDTVPLTFSVIFVMLTYNSTRFLPILMCACIYVCRTATNTICALTKNPPPRLHLFLFSHSILAVFTSLFSVTFLGSNQSAVASGSLRGLCIIGFADHFHCLS